MSYEFEPISYGDMIKNARESLDWGTKELLEDSEDCFDDDDDDLDYGFEMGEDGFYVIPDNDEVFEFMFDGHGNYMDDDYFSKRDSSDVLDFDEDEECPF